MLVTDIKWDTDGDEELESMLPKVMNVPEGLNEDAISDYISDQTGFCHFGFTLPTDK